MSNRHEEYEKEGLVVGTLSQAHKDALGSLTEEEHQEFKRIAKKVKASVPDGEMESNGFV